MGLKFVAPRVGAWIETTCFIVAILFIVSHPVWVRGLKHGGHKQSLVLSGVAPRVGAWIETVSGSQLGDIAGVAPRVGAWIETARDDIYLDLTPVAPRVGAWIETAKRA